TGCAYRWLESIYGRRVGYLYRSSCCTVIQTAAISSIAFVFSGALGTFIDLPHLPSEWADINVLGLQPFSNIGAKFASCILIIALTFVNIKGTKKGGKLSLVFTFLITVSILLITCVAFTNDVGSIHTFETVSKN